MTSLTDPLGQEGLIMRPAIKWASASMWGFLVIQAVGFTSIVLAVAGVLATTWSDWALALILVYARGFFIAAGYHRYFSHRSFEFRLPRLMQFLFALGACASVQKGPLWWARVHRDHHRYTDHEGDLHSPKLYGFWWAHMGWVMANNEPKGDIPDFSRFRELRWLDRWHVLPGILLAAACLLLGGWTTLLVGFFASTAALAQATFTVNSFAHLLGYRRYNTNDTSRNCPWLTPIVLGEQWHNNHHANQGLVRQGERWWEVDVTFYVLWLLSLLGITKNLKYAKK